MRVFILCKIKYGSQFGGNTEAPLEGGRHVKVVRR
jgi:hypothetical protein